ncbi:hypothetical protein M413DRAFT_180529 [Hebeloma cylindrosporum]|uniref:Uncharacterized protein n=1 Tax=Hebeloma cylindrosporum TaxID=76867 RepID=A0A0C3BSS5_HEBCY|nr:hypothetical protein M413DRAFT_180529 [Hebeloma cylindrosporum h7]
MIIVTYIPTPPSYSVVRQTMRQAFAWYSLLEKSEPGIPPNASAKLHQNVSKFTSKKMLRCSRCGIRNEGCPIGKVQIISPKAKDHIISWGCQEERSQEKPPEIWVKKIWKSQSDNRCILVNHVILERFNKEKALLHF